MAEGAGRCLCGAVRVRVNASKTSVDACHCGMCRRWGGGPLMSVSCGADVTFVGEEHITVYDSSEWAERGFCGKCGSHLFYRLKGTNDHQLAAGLFDNQQSFHFDLQVFIDRKPEFYDFSNKTRKMTEAEVIEKFAPNQNT